MSQQRARELIAEADSRLARGDRTGAAEAFARAARSDPHDAEPPLLEAMLHFEDGRLARAAELVLAALRIRPFNPQAANMLGVVCLDAGQVAASRRILGRLVTAVPGLRGAKRNLRQARRARGGSRIADFPIDEIRRWLATDSRRLGIGVVVEDPGADLEATLASVERLDAEVRILDATPEGLADDRRDCGTIHRVLPTGDRAALYDEVIRVSCTDWILLLESGQRLRHEDTAALEACLRRRRCLYHELEIRCRDGSARCREPRLFRNAAGLHCLGSVYPTLRYGLRELAAAWKLGATHPRLVVETDVLAPYGARRVSERRVLQAASREDLRHRPGHPYLLAQRARVLLETGQPDAALEAMAEIARTERTVHLEAEELALCQTLCLLRSDRHVEARARIGTYHDTSPATRSTLFLEGLACVAVGDDAAAARAYARCLREEGPVPLLPPLPELCSPSWPTRIGATLLDRGRFDEAREAFELTLAADPADVEARTGLLALRLARGEIEALLQDLDRWVEEQGERTRVWSYGGVLLGKLPELAPVAMEWMDEACRRFPDDEGLRRQQVEAHLRRGCAESALALLDRLPGETPAELAARFAASLVVGADLPPLPSETRQAVQGEVLGWLRLWLACESYTALDRALLGMERAAAGLPELPARVAAWLEEIGQAEAATRIRQQPSVTAAALRS